MTEPMELPRASPEEVSIVVLNLDGLEHLPACLEAAVASDGLAGQSAVVVADNGSTDGSLRFVASEFPGVRTLSFGSNLGFAGGNNRAAEAVSSPYVLFLNNDTRIGRGALRELCAATGGRASCVGARLVSWDGKRLDFDGGGSSFTGHGHALGYGKRVPRDDGDTRPVLFCSGAALLVHRSTFLDLGGFDPDYYFYYEDVDLGWRHWVAGYSCLHVPAAVVHHRHHGTADRIPGSDAARLYERNALATVAKNYGAPLLRSALPAALALAAHRAGAGLDVIESAACEARGAAAGPTASGQEATAQSRSPLPIPPPDWPGWPKLESLGLDFTALAARRSLVQARRRRPDSAILPLLGSPLAPVPPSGESWRAMRIAVEVFGLDEHFGPMTGGSPTPTRWLCAACSALREGGLRELVDGVRRGVPW